MTGLALGARVFSSMFALEPPPYLLRLRDWLRDAEPNRWRWFASDSFASDSRLFDLSRRNRLLYSQPRGQSIDLTEVSVPLVLDIRNLAPESLLTCRPALVAQLDKLEPIALGRFL